MVRPLTEGEAAFATLKGEVSRTYQKTTARASWIYQDTWRLADIRTALQRAGRASATEVRQVRRELLQALQANIRKIVQEAVTSIELLMESGKAQEAWVRISRWYRQARGAQAPPTTEALDEVTVEREGLYKCRPPEGLRVPLLMRKSDIEDVIPTEA